MTTPWRWFGRCRQATPAQREIIAARLDDLPAVFCTPDAVALTATFVFNAFLLLIDVRSHRSCCRNRRRTIGDSVSHSFAVHECGLWLPRGPVLHWTRRGRK